MTASTTFEQLYLDAPVKAATTTRISARAAYQAVLTGDTVLVDVRPARQRLAHGVVHPDLEPLTLAATELGGLRGDVILVCADGQTSGRAAEVLRRLGVVSARAIEGGYGAWRAAGMPTS